MSLRFWVYISLALAFNFNVLSDETTACHIARLCVAGLAGVLTVVVDNRCGKLSWSLKSKSRTKAPAEA